MARPPKKREPQAAVTFSNGRYHGFVSVRAPNGKMVRRHRSGHNRDQVAAKLLELEDKRDQNQIVPIGEMPKLGEYLYTWLTDIAPLTASESTIDSVYTFVVKLVDARRGGFGLDEISGPLLNGLYRDLKAEQYSSKTRWHVHTVLKSVFASAITDGLLTVNPADAAKAPTVVPNSPRAFDDDELDALISAIQRRPNGRLRWYLALLGARQGEALGAKHRYLNRDTGVLAIVGKAQRRKYKHGCADPVKCAEKHHRTEDCPGRVWQHGCADPRSCAARKCNRPAYPSEQKREAFGARGAGAKCPPGCTGHARSCPDRVKGACGKHKNCAPCPAGCAEHAKQCPQRRGGLMIVEDQPVPEPSAETQPARRRGRKRDRGKPLSTKTPAGQRYIALPPFALTEVDIELEQQRADQKVWGSKWVDHGLLVCNEKGGPIDPRRDWDVWNEISDDAGVEYREPHVNRKSAATVMLKLGMDRRVVMAWFGWESEAMLKTYQDVPEQLLIDAAKQMGSHYGGPATRSATRRVEPGHQAGLV